MEDLSLEQIELLEKFCGGLISKNELIEGMPSDFTLSEIGKLIDDYQIMQDVISWDAIKSNPELVSASNYTKVRRVSKLWIGGGLSLLIAMVVSVTVFLTDNESKDERVIDNSTVFQDQEVVVLQEKEVTNHQETVAHPVAIAEPHKENDEVVIEPMSPVSVDSKTEKGLKNILDTLIVQTSPSKKMTDTVIVNDTIIPKVDVVECNSEIITRVVVEKQPCEGEANGLVKLESSGGKSPYSYKLNEEEVDVFVDYLEAGDYDLITKDSLGCHSEQVFRVSEKVCEQLMENVYSVSISNNDVITLPSIKGEFTVISSGGRLVYSTITEGQGWSAIDNQGKVLTTGAYIFIFKSETGTIKGEINVLR